MSAGAMTAAKSLSENQTTFFSPSCPRPSAQRSTFHRQQHAMKPQKFLSSPPVSRYPRPRPVIGTFRSAQKRPPRTTNPSATSGYDGECHECYRPPPTLPAHWTLSSIPKMRSRNAPRTALTSTYPSRFFVNPLLVSPFCNVRNLRLPTWSSPSKSADSSRTCVVLDAACSPP